MSNSRPLYPPNPLQWEIHRPDVALNSIITCRGVFVKNAPARTSRPQTGPHANTIAYTTHKNFIGQGLALGEQ